MDKESWRRGGDSRPDPRGETSLDELAKGLANGTISRRQALRWMGGALVGGVLASIPGVALAQQGGNSYCAHYCTQAFPPGQERGQCISDAAHGTGACFACGQEDPCAGQTACGENDCSTVPLVGAGQCFCHQPIFCDFAQPCQGQEDCGAGFMCANSCCGEPLCLPECGNCVEGTFCMTDAAAVAAASSARTSAG